MCLEGVNSGGAQTIDSASCSSINNGRDRFYFEDNGDGYCTLKARTIVKEVLSYWGSFLVH